jgi:hypothetical protein
MHPAYVETVPCPSLSPGRPCWSPSAETAPSSTRRAQPSARASHSGRQSGTQGFLAELESNELHRLLDAAEGRYTLMRRMMLDVELHRKGRLAFSDCASTTPWSGGLSAPCGLRPSGTASGSRDSPETASLSRRPTGPPVLLHGRGRSLVEPSAIILFTRHLRAQFGRAFLRIGAGQAGHHTDGQACGEAACYLWTEITCRNTGRRRDSGAPLNYVTLLAHVRGKAFTRGL